MDLLCVRAGVVVQRDRKPDFVRELDGIASDGTYEYVERPATVEDFYHPDSGWMIDPGDVGVGQAYDGSKFGPIPELPAVPAKTTFSAREFVQVLFTEDEREAIFTARRTDWRVDEFVTLATAGDVDVSDPQVRAGLAYLVGGRLLTQKRADAVCAGALP